MTGSWRRRRSRGGGVLGPVLVLLILVVVVFLLTHSGVPWSGESIPVTSPPVWPASATPTPALPDEIHARFGDKYDGYENLIRRTPSGGFDTREADAKMAGLPASTTTPVPRSTPEFLSSTIPVPQQSAMGEIESAILRYTNAERTAAGVPVLAEDSCMNGVARAHSEDMASGGYFSHVNLQGQDPSSRASAHGCPTMKPVAGGSTRVGIGENIGKMPTGNVVGIGYVRDTPEDVARAQVDSWMSSPGHRGNILDPSYSRLGVGTARDSSGYYISTQDFW